MAESSSKPQSGIRDREYPLSEATRQASALRRIAELAPTLKEAELRVLMALTSLTATPENSIHISSRKLADLSRVARRNVQRALDSLTERCIITTRQGTPKQPAGILLNFLATITIGGAAVTPPPTRQWRQTSATGGAKETPQVALFERQGGPETGPPPGQDDGVDDAGARVDSNSNFDLIDRLLRASPSDYEREAIAKARACLHGYAVKLGREKDRHPPDDRLVAQFLSIAPWQALERLIYDLMAERKQPGYAYAWFVAVALQRIHGIQPGTLKQRRAELRVVERAPARQPEPRQAELLSADAEADPQFSEALLADVLTKRKAAGK
jgi:hypothetical protein